MSVRVIFSCHFCGVRPDEETQRSLEQQLQLLLHGTYLDAEPANWLTWHGRGTYGRNTYACPEHRAELKRYLRENHGGWHTRAQGPHPAGWHFRGAVGAARRRKRMYGVGPRATSG